MNFLKKLLKLGSNGKQPIVSGSFLEQFDIVEPEWHRKRKIIGGRHEVNMGKIKEKIPMRRMIITEDNEIWEYHITDSGRTIWQYYASFVQENLR